MTEPLPPVTLALAPNGGRRTKADHPALPTTARELADLAAPAVEVGVSMLHIHVRNERGEHVLDAGLYREAIARIRGEVGDRLVIQPTSESLGRFLPAQQMAAVLDLKPEAVSLAVRELAPDDGHEVAFAEFMAMLRRENIMPQIILYAPEEAVRLAAMLRRGLIPFEDIPVLYALGRYVPGQSSAPSDLLPFLAPDMPRFAHWMVCAFGPRETACVGAAALLGGHARVGFENNLLLPDGKLAADNIELAAGAATAIRAHGSRLANANELRTAWARLTAR